jgi:hypothetical protein
MNIKEIERLIAKFYEGETTLAEEELLRGFFRGEEIPEHLAEHGPMFAFFEKEQKEEIQNPEFDKILSLKLGEDDGKVIPMTPRKTRIAYITSIAAAAVLLIGIAVTVVFDFNTGSKFTKENELAYAEAQEALMIISSNLNCGVSQVRYLNAFDKGMEHMQMLSKFYEYQTLIINPGEVQASSTTNK